MKDIEIRIKELEDELKELREEEKMRKEQREPKPWKPKCMERYYFIKNGFYVGCCRSQNNRTDKRNFEIGNCFPTRERAEQVVKKMRLLLRLEQLHDQLCPDYEPDWKDGRLKYRVYFSHFQGKYGVNCSNNIEDSCVVVFDTNENAEKAAEILNKELERGKK